jgi:hypothetical protein
MFRKHANAPSLVVPVQRDDKRTWGDTDHALAYNRFSTGGSKTIGLRDRIWWHGVQGGGTLHWSRRQVDAPALGTSGVLIIVDGHRHARQLRPLFASPAGVSRRWSVAAVITGGLQGACSNIAPLLGLQATACDERRLRIFDMEIGRDHPATTSMAQRGAAGRVLEQNDRGPPRSMPQLRATRIDAEATADLGQMVRAARPALMLAMDDPESPGVRAAARLARVGGLPLLQVPAAAPTWALDSLATLRPDQLVRWGATDLAIVVFVQADSDVSRLAALRDSLCGPSLATAGRGLTHAPTERLTPHVISAARARTSIALLFDFAVPTVVTTFVQRSWAWPRHAKTMRYRVESVGGSCASPAQREVLQMLEAWEPVQQKARGRALLPNAQSWSLILRSDNVELSEGFHVYVSHFLATYEPEAIAAPGSNARLLGIALGAQSLSGHSNVATPTCGSVYVADAWDELRKFASLRLGLTHGGPLCDEGGKPISAAEDTELDWVAVEKLFMREHGFTLHYTGLNLCRVRGDESTKLASGEEVAAMLRRRSTT